MSEPARFDAVVVGAGAAGLFCAGQAGQRGLRVLVIDHAEKVAEKIRISGGGRCNFTNLGTTHAHFESSNPNYCRSALDRFTPRDFVALVERHGIAWHEKHKGQLFCDGSSGEIVDLLLAECATARVERWQPCEVTSVGHGDEGFRLETARGAVVAPRLVVATGGLSIPKIGATGWGYALARQFGHAIVETRPGLVPLVCSGANWERFAALSGVALPVRIASDGPRPEVSFDEDLLFTHRGLSGPAALQISTWWRPGEPLEIDLLPEADLATVLREGKLAAGRRLGATLVEQLPRRLVDAWLQAGPSADSRLADLRDRELAEFADGLRHWRILPAGTEGYRKAEVTAGGVDTRELESRSGESKRLPGLFFIGEVVDVTGWLGGYNFQWAWASGAACAEALAFGC